MLFYIQKPTPLAFAKEENWFDLIYENKVYTVINLALHIGFL